MRLIALALSLLVSFAPLAFSHSLKPQSLKIGVLQLHESAGEDQLWSASLAQLKSALPAYEWHLVPLSLAEIERQTASRELDFIITNPGQYVALESQYAITRIATLKPSPHSSWAVGSALIVRQDSPLTDFNDLRQARLAVVDTQAFGGYYTAMREVAKVMADWETAIALEPVGFPMERVVEAVLKGQVDAGIIRACLLETLISQNKIDPIALRVLAPKRVMDGACTASTPPYPDWPFAARGDLPLPLVKQVAMALLAMPDHGPQSWTVPVDYQPVHDLFRELKLGPYEHLRIRSIGDWALEYWHLLAFVALALIWGAIHLWRVEILVRQRTTQLRREQASALKSRHKLEQATRLALMGEMASNIAHELNQPLAAITNFASGSKRRLGHNDLKGAMLGLEEVLAQVQRAGQIITNTRQLLRQDQAPKARLPLSKIISESLRQFAAARLDHGLKVQIDLPSEIKVTANGVQLQQVFLNLMQNALDAQISSPSPWIRFSLFSNDDYLEIHVHDGGAGVAKECQDSLFTPFFTTKPDGLGLGLSLIRSILESHGGSIRYDMDYFVLRLPR